ncbi:MAG TPA: MFS transporter [Jatrophihabitantaceae bacterium]|jgi:EmrB/QacA subfamily drug resistance transporter|nr:MFS transporter [Jatrophihabitantaceae bacterium]
MAGGLRRLLTEPARPARVRDWPGAPWLAVAAVCIGAFMGQLDASIVTLALPDLRTQLHASLGSVEWVSLIYLLVLVGSVSAAGRLADMAGRKLLYTYGFAVFTLASLGCGLAPNLAVLLLARVVQALGAAMLQANSVAMIRTTVAAGALNRAIGLQGAAQALGLALGPAVGGLLIELGGWRWVFYVNLPAGVVGIVLGVLLLPRTPAKALRTRLDWAGLATLLPASAGLLLALSLAGRDGFSIPIALVATCAVAVAVLFVVIERHSRSPLVDLSLFADRAFAAGISSGLLAYLVLFGALLVSPLYLESAYRLPSGTAGLIICVLPVALGLTAPLAGAGADRFGARTLTTTGMALTCLALSVAALTVGDRSVLVAMLGLAGIGLGLFTPANNTAVARAGSTEQAGMVSGVLNMTRGVGTSLGIAVAGAGYTLAVGTAGVASAAAAGHGFRVTVLVLTVAAALAAVLAAGSPVRGMPSRATM